MHPVQNRPVIYGACLLALLFIWPFGGGTTERLAASPSVPGARATATVSHDQNNNTTVDLKVKFLPPPTSLTPARAVYVVWIQANGHPVQNKGQLVVGGDHEGQIKLRTAFPNFELFITPESSALVSVPTGPRVISGRITRA